MKILIVNSDAIEAGKIKLVLSRYGDCEIVPGGKEAVDAFAASHQQAAPLGFISLETDMDGMKGNEAAEAIRKWETDNQKDPKVKILLTISEAARQTLGPPLEALDVRFLIKPYNRKTLEAALNGLGLKKSPVKKAAAPAKPKAAVPPPPAVKKPRDPEVDLTLRKITTLAIDPEKLQGGDARIELESLVKKGAKEAELLMGQLMTSPKVPLQSRMELARCAGYIRSPLFLVPLNRVLDSEDNIRMVEVALVSISRYNDQRALNILNNALKKIKNPMLLNTVRQQIGKIKQDKPVLALLPRFLSSHKSMKNFRVTLNILKNIMSPEDTPLFLNYLKSGNATIEEGTFELLCYAGDKSIKAAIFDFFRDRLPKIKCLGQPNCDELFRLVSNQNYYLVKNPSLLEEQIPRLIELYPSAKDSRAKQALIAILCKSGKPETLEFIKSIYSQEESYRQWIIEKLSGNNAALDFLFEKYNEGKELLEPIITTLLKSDRGLHYFIEHFFSFELDRQEVIVKNLTFADQPFFIDFIRKIYDTKLYSLKSHLMTVIRDNYLFDFKDILYDPANQREFMFMGKVYLETITRLFPLTSIKMLFEKIAYEDISINKMKTYLGWIMHITAVELVFHFTNGKLAVDLFNRIMKSNNIELSVLFFKSFENMKILQLPTYKFLLDAANTFTANRGANITEKEKGIVTKLKQRLRDQFPDIRESQNMPKELRNIFLNKPIETEQLEKFIKTNQMGISLNIEKMCVYMAGRLKNAEYISDDDRQVFLMQFPMIAKFMDFLRSKGMDQKQDWENIKNTGKLLKHFAKDLRVIIAFKNKHITAILRDQLITAIPEFQILMNEETLQENDILVCDPEALKNYINKKAISKHRVFLYLENRSEYAQFRAINPKAFMKPFSAYRVVKMLMQELYLAK
jgi:CheY-like chemotaxis protein